MVIATLRWRHDAHDRWMMFTMMFAMMPATQGGLPQGWQTCVLLLNLHGGLDRICAIFWTDATGPQCHTIVSGQCRLRKGVILGVILLISCMQLLDVYASAKQPKPQSSTFRMSLCAAMSIFVITATCDNSKAFQLKTTRYPQSQAVTKFGGTASTGTFLFEPLDCGMSARSSAYLAMPRPLGAEGNRLRILDIFGFQFRMMPHEARKPSTAENNPLCF